MKLLACKSVKESGTDSVVADLMGLGVATICVDAEWVVV